MALTGSEVLQIQGVDSLGRPAGATETATTQQIANLAVAAPAGLSGNIQYNNSGALGGYTDLQVANRIGVAQNYFNVLNYGAKGDGKTLSDVTTTNTSAVISSTSYTFTQADVGKYITIAGAGAAAAVLNSTISSVSGGNATLVNTAGTSKAGNAVATFGTDDSAAIQAAVTAATAAGGGVVVLPPLVFVVAATITWASLVSLIGSGMFRSTLKWISTSSMTSAVIQGTSGTKDIQYTNCEFSDFEIDGLAATQSSYNVAGKGIYIQFMINPVFQRLYVHDTPASGLGVDHLRYGIIANNIVQNCGRLNSGSNLGGAGIGVAVGGSFPSASYPESCVVVGNSVIDNKRYGIFFESVGSSDASNSFAVITGNYVHLSATSGHGIGDCGMLNINISANTVVGVSGCLDGIIANEGTLTVAVGTKGLISGNVISTCRNGVSLDYSNDASSGTLCQYVVKNNKIESSASHGIQVKTKASRLLDTLAVSDNQIIASGGNGIYFTGTGNMKGVSVKFNKSLNNTGAGFKADCAIANISIVANDFLDEQSSPTQTYGIQFDSAGAAITDAFIVNNKLTGNVTNSYALTNSATLTGKIINNGGYNPVGPSSVSPGASPWTYTAGVSPETLYISAGTISGITKNGVTMGITTPAAISLNPNDAVIVTYSVAPTVVKDIA